MKIGNGYSIYEGQFFKCFDFDGEFYKFHDYINGIRQNNGFVIIHKALINLVKEIEEPQFTLNPTKKEQQDYELDSNYAKLKSKLNELSEKRRKLFDSGKSKTMRSAYLLHQISSIATEMDKIRLLYL